MGLGETAFARRERIILRAILTSCTRTRKQMACGFTLYRLLDRGLGFLDAVNWQLLSAGTRALRLAGLRERLPRRHGSTIGTVGVRQLVSLPRPAYNCDVTLNYPVIVDIVILTEDEALCFCRIRPGGKACVSS
jgi:hypothetical protein